MFHSFENLLEKQFCIKNFEYILQIPNVMGPENNAACEVARNDPESNSDSLSDEVLNEILAELGVNFAENVDVANPMSAIENVLTTFFQAENYAINAERETYIRSIHNLSFGSEIIGLISIISSNNILKVLYFLLYQFLKHLNVRRGGFLNADLIHSLVISILKDCCNGDFRSLFDMIFT